MIVTLWVFCIIFALLQVIAVVFLLTGRGEKFLVVEEKRDQYHLDRVRILTIILSISATALSITVPLLINNPKAITLASGVCLAVIVIIVILIKTWAKKKYEY